MLVEQIIVRFVIDRMRTGDSSACDGGEGSCDKGDACELHSWIERPALNPGVSGRHLYIAVKPHCLIAIQHANIYFIFPEDQPRPCA